MHIYLICAGGQGDMPWAASGSIFSMLNDPSTAQPPAAAQLPPKHKSHKKVFCNALRCA